MYQFRLQTFPSIPHGSHIANWNIFLRCAKMIEENDDPSEKKDDFIVLIIDMEIRN